MSIPGAFFQRHFKYPLKGGLEINNVSRLKSFSAIPIPPAKCLAMNYDYSDRRKIKWNYSKILS